MDRYQDRTVDYSQQTNAHFETWYTDFKKKLHQERNPAALSTNDPRFAAGPWGIQAASNKHLTRQVRQSHSEAAIVLPPNVATCEIPPVFPPSSIVPLGLSSSLYHTSPLQKPRETVAKKLPPPENKKTTLSPRAMAEKLAALLQHESMLRERIQEAEAKFRDYCLQRTQLPIGLGLSHKRDNYGQREMATTVRLYFQQRFEGIINEERSNRISFTECYEMWLRVIREKFVKEMHNAMVNTARYGKSVTLLSVGALQRVQLDESEMRHSIQNAQEALYEQLRIRSSKLRVTATTMWRAKFIRHVDASSPAITSTLPFKYDQRATASPFNQLVTNEARQRSSLMSAEEGFRSTIESALFAQKSITLHRNSLVVERLRALCALGARPIEMAEQQGRSMIEEASEGWFQGISSAYIASQSKLEEVAKQKARLIAAALARLPKLSDIEEDEAARRRYFIRACDDWCQNTFSAVASQLRSFHVGQSVAYRSVRTILAHQLDTLESQEVAARAFIENSEIDWNRHLQESEKRSRNECVPKLVSRKPENGQLTMFARQIVALEEEEGLQRNALELAEMQWARFNASRLRPMGTMPVATVLIPIQNQRMAESKPLPQSTQGSASVPWDIHDPLSNIARAGAPTSEKQEKAKTTQSIKLPGTPLHKSESIIPLNQPLSHRVANTSHMNKGKSTMHSSSGTTSHLPKKHT